MADLQASVEATGSGGRVICIVMLVSGLVTMCEFLMKCEALSQSVWGSGSGAWFCVRAISATWSA